MSGAWTIRRVTASDGAGLAAFARRLWPRRHPGAFARSWWMNASPAQCLAAFADDGTVGGVCAAREQRVLVRGVAARAAGICDWYLDPSTRGAGLGRRLVDEALREVEVGWACSLSAEAEKAFRKLGFLPDPAHRVPLFLAPSALVAARLALARAGQHAVETRDLDHASVDSLAVELEQAWRLRLEPNYTGGVHDLEAWRAHLALVPGRTYQAHLLRGGRGELVALAVSRRLARGGFPRLGPTRLTLLSELLCDRSRLDALRPLLRRVAADALRAGSELLFYPAYDPPVHEALASAGFFSAQASFLGLRVGRLSTRFMVRQAVAPEVEPSRWRVTPLDCDYDLGLGVVTERPASPGGPRPPGDGRPAPPQREARRELR